MMELMREEIDTIDAMRRYGGDFAERLASALLNTDSGAHLLVELAKCYGPGDDINRQKVLMLLKHGGLLVAMSERDRFTLITDCFPVEWAKYSAMAPTSARSGESQ